jgi:uncharacterized OsmC-like protein
LTSEATGEIELDDGVLVIRRLHVRYQLRLRPEQRPAAERAYRVHADHCPVYRTIQGCVAITTSLEIADVAADDAAQ